MCLAAQAAPGAQAQLESLEGTAAHGPLPSPSGTFFHSSEDIRRVRFSGTSSFRILGMLASWDRSLSNWAL